MILKWYWLNPWAGVSMLLFANCRGGKVGVISFTNCDFRSMYLKKDRCFSCPRACKDASRIRKIKKGKSRQQQHNILDREEKWREPFEEQDSLVLGSRENTYRRLEEAQMSTKSEEQCEPAAKYPQSLSSDPTRSGENAEPNRRDLDNSVQSENK